MRFIQSCVCLTLLGALGCLLPIRQTESASPPLLGLFHHADGAPASGARIAVSTKDGDSTCANASLATTTDAEGHFALPRTLVRRRGILLVPPIERFSNLFRLCARRATDSASHMIFEGRVPLSREAPSQTVTCFEWMWDNQDRVTCTTSHEPTVADGGRWNDGASTGWYRLIVTTELARAPGYRRPVPRPHAYVLWIEGSATHPPVRVRETVRLPIDEKVTALAGADLLERSGRYYASLPGYKKTFMNDFAAAELQFELGPPGQVTKVAEP